MRINLGHKKYLVACLFTSGILTGCTNNIFSAPPPQESAATVRPAEQSVEVAESSQPKPQSQVSVPAPHNDSWQRLRNGYRLSGIEHPRIDDAIGWFTSNKSVIRKSSERATPLLHYILESVENRNLPTELALIPLLETGFRVHARSPYGALGPWQFMPATGRQYGLGRTAYLDQRRDIVLATEAALSYLNDLHVQFDGDWLLAIAAYNGGPGTIKKALNGNKHSFWDVVDKLPKETQTYVPKLLAAARIISNPLAYNIKLKAIPNESYFETIQVQGPVDFDVLKTLEKWDQKTFRRLNGALSSGFYGRKDMLNVQVPVGTGEKISAHLQAAGPPKKRDSFQYRVQRGDTLGALAIRFNVPIREIRRFNGLHGNNIRAGKNIIIPGSATQLATKVGDTSNLSQHHIVKPGDSFWTLGRRFDVSARTLARHNNLAINKTLYPGQMLLIPTGVSTISLNKSLAKLNYVVERGDSLWSIAKRFGVATNDLKRWNPLIKSNLLRPGQKLLVQTP